MEEIDSIILQFLRHLNIKIDDDISTICDLPVETIIASVSACLIAINQSLKIPTKLPSGISHRIEVAAQLASVCKDLGYKNDVGYQTFLYYNEAELRQVFMFLIERLPSENKQTNKATHLNKKSLLLQNISNKIDEELKSVRIPPCCNQAPQKNIGDFEKILDSSSLTTVSPKVTTTLTEEYLMEKLKLITQCKEESAKTQDHTSNESIETKSDNQEVVKYETSKSLKELKETAIVLRQKMDTLESERNVMEVEYSQAIKLCERVEGDLKNVQNILNSIGITHIDADGVTGNILDKVQRNIDKLHQKSEDLTSKNLSLKMKIDYNKSNLALTESERTMCKKTLVNLKETAKSMKEEYEKIEELRNQLKKNYAQLKGGNKRSIYTKRIMEIISNVDKQNMEIQKILEDTRQLQKEINILEDQLDRCFSMADEMLFKDAKKDDQAKKAYKLLALLHSECNTIVSLVNDTGTIAREIVDLEDNIKAEKAKRTEDTLKKIQHDLTRMEDEHNGFQ